MTTPATAAAAAPVVSVPVESAAERAESFKKRGNDLYKSGEYQDAIRLYSQAIAALPTEGSYYGNRAACWVMLKEFKRAADDCTDGLRHEKRVGELDKLRQRHANAFAQMGKLDSAIAMLEEIVKSETSGVAVAAGGGSAGPAVAFASSSSSAKSSNSATIATTSTSSSSAVTTTVTTSSAGNAPGSPSSVTDSERSDIVSMRTEKEVAAFKEQLQTLRTIKTNVETASTSLANGEFRYAIVSIIYFLVKSDNCILFIIYTRTAIQTEVSPNITDFFYFLFASRNYFVFY
jgi:tetratricopeptide (TPR) repeat protein